jgi:hypothetical protein
VTLGDSQGIPRHPSELDHRCVSAEAGPYAAIRNTPD